MAYYPRVQVIDEATGEVIDEGEDPRNRVRASASDEEFLFKVMSDEENDPYRAVDIAQMAFWAFNRQANDEVRQRWLDLLTKALERMEGPRPGDAEFEQVIDRELLSTHAASLHVPPLKVFLAFAAL